MTAWTAGAALAGLFILLGAAHEWQKWPGISHAQERPPLEYERCQGKPYHETPITVTAVTSGTPPTLEHYRIEWETNLAGARGVAEFRVSDGDPPQTRRRAGYWPSDGPYEPSRNRIDYDVEAEIKYWYQIAWLSAGWEENNDEVIACSGTTNAENDVVIAHDPEGGEPQPVATPTPTPTPTVDPTVDPTVEPTVEPTATATRAPTATPADNGEEQGEQPTPQPTAPPTVAATPQPTLAPTPAPTPAPTAEPRPTARPNNDREENDREENDRKPDPTATPTDVPTPSPTATATPTPPASPTPTPTPGFQVARSGEQVLAMRLGPETPPPTATTAPPATATPAPTATATPPTLTAAAAAGPHVERPSRPAIAGIGDALPRLREGIRTITATDRQRLTLVAALVAALIAAASVLAYLLLRKQ